MAEDIQSALELLEEDAFHPKLRTHKLKGEQVMTNTIEAIYEDKVFKPVSKVEGLKEHDRVKLTFHPVPMKEELRSLVGTLTVEEAQEMNKIMDAEFERIDNGW